MEENKENIKEEDVLEEEQTNEQETNEEDDGMPFPKARIVRIIKNEIKNEKQIRSEVKDAINIWLGNLLKRVAKKMGDTQFGSIGMADFQRATKPYDMVTDIVKEQERLMLSIQKLDADANHISREFERFFKVLKGNKE